MKKILFSLITLGLVGGTVFAFSSAFFSDTETSTGNVLGAGSIDLLIDNTSYYNGAVSPSTTWTLSDLTIQKFFDFHDVKPGDVGEDTISVHVNDNDSWLCADVTLTSNDDNGLTGPESIAGDVTDGTGSGELAGRVNFIWWADDGDNVLEDDETVLPGGPLGALSVGQTANVRLADSTGSIWTPAGPLPGATTRYIGKAWCFGTLTTVPLPQDGLGVLSARTPANSTGGVSCNGSAEGNQTQSDSLTADITFQAMQARHNETFVCGQRGTPTPTPSVSITPIITPTPSLTPSITPTPTPLACVERFANSVVSSSQGTRKNATGILATRIDPTQALVPQSTGAAFDSPVNEGTFFSLGFKIGQPANGSLVVQFAAPFFNGPGNDLRIYEVTGGPPYPDEKVMVEASPNGTTWTLLTSSLTKDGTVDLGILPSAQFVRLTDVSNINDFEDTADAYDVDGVQALCGQ